MAIGIITCGKDWSKDKDGWNAGAAEGMKLQNSFNKLMSKEFPEMNSKESTIAVKTVALDKCDMYKVFMTAAKLTWNSCPIK